MAMLCEQLLVDQLTRSLSDRLIERFSISIEKTRRNLVSYDWQQRAYRGKLHTIRNFNNMRTILDGGGSETWFSSLRFDHHRQTR